MDEQDASPLSAEDLAAEGATLLPAKEVLSLLDLNVDVDVALDFVAPIDLAVAANLNVAAPINAAVGANVLSALSEAAAQSDQAVAIDQLIAGEAIANAPQSSVIDQSNDIPDDGSDLPPAPPPVTTGSLLDGDLLNVDVNIAVDADLAAPIAGAVAANANVVAPIDAAVSANVGSVSSEAIAVSNQQAVINQSLDGVVAEATADQDAEITQ